MEAYSVAELVLFLETVCTDIEPETLNVIKSQKISGKRALRLTLQDWNNIGVPYGEAVDITGAINDLQNRSIKYDNTRNDLGSDRTVKGFGNTESSDEDSFSLKMDLPHNNDDDDPTDDDDDNRGSDAGNVPENDRFACVKGFFTENQFASMSSYQRESYLSQYRVYEAGKKLNLQMQPPAFMQLQPACVSEPKKPQKKQQDPQAASNRSTTPEQTITRVTRQTKNKQPVASLDFSKSLDVNVGASTSKAVNVCSSSPQPIRKRPRNSSSIQFNDLSLLETDQEVETDHGSKSSANDGNSSVGQEQATKKKRRIKRKKRPEDKLSEEEFAATLPQFEIDVILTKAGKKLKPVKAKLEKDGLVSGKDRKLLIQTLAKFLYFEHVNNIKLVTTDMKSGMACSLVSSYPRFKDTTNPSKKSWWRIFDPSGPSGYLANCIAGIFRGLDPKDRPRGGGRGASYSSEDEDDDNASKDKENETPGDKHPEADWMKLTMPWDTNKRKLLQGMEVSFESRRQWICKKQPSITEILSVYPHLVSFDCELMEKEFDMIHPNKGHMFSKGFPHLVLSLKAKNDLHEVEDLGEGANCDMLGACLALRVALPRPNLQRHTRKKQTGSVESVMPSLSSLITIVPLGTNVQDTVDQRRKNSNSPVQPHLLALMPQKEITKLYVVADSKIIQLASPCLLRGLDMLFKAYTIFNVQYPLGWAPFWDMIEHGIYQIVPSKLSNSAVEVLRLHNIIK